MSQTYVNYEERIRYSTVDKIKLLCCWLTNQHMDSQNPYKVSICRYCIHTVSYRMDAKYQFC